MKFAHQHTTQINTLSQAVIEAKNCFKVKVRNDSPGPITVNGLVIEPQKEETFDGLPADTVFGKDWELNMDDVRQPNIYVTRYTYIENAC